MRVLLLVFSSLLSGCLSLGVTGSAQPTSNTEIQVGAKVNQHGTVRPSGRVIYDLF